METIDELLSQADKITPENYTPALLLAPARELIKNGKEQIIDSVRNFLSDYKGTSGHFGLFVLLRVAFRLPASMQYPAINIGKFDFDEPAGHGQSIFPLMMVNNVPFLIITGYFSGGFPQPVEDHLIFYENNANLRESLFMAGDATATLAADAQKQWEDIYSMKMPERLRSFVEKQAGSIISQLNEN